jgi:dTDP-4-amino-4,6-dideoxygalactose transaminase
MTTKQRLEDLAAFGGTPAITKPLHVGQLYLPEWSEFEKVFRGIFHRRYFTNHGPLVQELDDRFAEHLGVRNAISVTNGTVSLMVAAKSLYLRGEVIVPAFTFPATVQALDWAGLTPVFCDVDPATHNLTADLVEPLISDRTCAVLGVHLWGRACDPHTLQDLCDRHGLVLFFDAAHAVDCTCHGRKIGGFGRVESFSFHATTVLNGGEGGCLTTNDNKLANRIRTVRNFHVSESFAKVPLRINGKMSEAQAAMALLGLKGLPSNITHNRSLYEIYSQRAEDWRGLRLVDIVKGESVNYQYCVFEMEPMATTLNRDQLLHLLWAEQVLARRYFYPGLQRMAPYASLYPQYRDTLPTTESLCARLLQLPIGASVTPELVQRVSDLLDFILEREDEIVERLEKTE